MSTFDDQLNKIKNDKGFIAALDQSGGSTPKALKLYGVGEDAWKDEQGMYDVVHAMRTRIVTSPAFSGKLVLISLPCSHSLSSCPKHPLVQSSKLPTSCGLPWPILKNSLKTRPISCNVRLIIW